MYRTMHHSHNNTPLHQLVHIFTLIKRTLTLSRCDKSCYQKVLYLFIFGTIRDNDKLLFIRKQIVGQLVDVLSNT